MDKHFTDFQFNKNYMKLHQIGRGGFAEVWSAITKPDNKDVALKIIDLEQSITNEKDQVQQESELETLGNCDHPNITKLLDDFMMPTNKLYMVMELVQGVSLEAVYQPEPGMALDVIAFVCSQMVNALHYLHSKSILHRDIKPANVLLSTSGTVKICDFGFATYVGRNDTTTRLMGTLNYLAPELLKTSPKYTYSTGSDVWALGVTVAAMASASQPYCDINDKRFSYEEKRRLVLRNTKRGLPINENILSNLPNELVDFLHICLVHTDVHRACADELRRHCWLTYAASAQSLGELVTKNYSQHQH